MRTLLLSAAATLLTSSISLAAPTQVWVNTDTNTYHCPGSQYYGKTKVGKYVTEAQAKKEGDKPANDKACS